MTGWRWRAAALVAIGLMAASCGREPAAPEPSHEDAGASGARDVDDGWGYEGDRGPEHWGTLSADFAACAEGRAQSPIDIVEPVASSLDPLAPRYDGRFVEAVNLGHTLQLTVSPGSSLQVGERRADLLQMHLHAPSEHMVAGERFPLEAHFVHRDDAGALLVVGLLYREGEAGEDPGEDHEPIAAMIASLPAEPGARNPVDLDVKKIGLRAGEPYYRYDGSLTTPPCTEGVAWHVLQAPRTVSREQLAAIRRVVTTSARPIQPLGGREVRASAGM